MISIMVYNRNKTSAAKCFTWRVPSKKGYWWVVLRTMLQD